MSPTSSTSVLEIVVVVSAVLFWFAILTGMCCLIFVAIRFCLKKLNVNWQWKKSNDASDIVDCKLREPLLSSEERQTVNETVIDDIPTAPNCLPW